MANTEHLNIVRHGSTAISQWRTQNPNINFDLAGADLVETNLEFSDLRGADLQDAVLVSANLFRADLRTANLTRANLLCARLVRTNLSEARLCDADLTEADLTMADLSRTDLSGAHLALAILNATKLKDTIIYGASFAHSLLCDLDLSDTRGLETAFHWAPSTVGADTLFKSGGKIPKAFLDGAGVPIVLTDYLFTLALVPSVFFSCFISFAEPDDAFAKQLYDDLRFADVRCWRWKEDAKWGSEIMAEVDKAIRDHDKVIIVASKSSLESPLVIREIERGLQKEDDLGRRGLPSNVLFPIRLDDFILSEWQHHRKADLLSKHIGDFRTWSISDHYRKSFRRLLHDLKST